MAGGARNARAVPPAHVTAASLWGIVLAVTRPCQSLGRKRESWEPGFAVGCGQGRSSMVLRCRSRRTTHSLHTPLRTMLCPHQLRTTPATGPYVALPPCVAALTWYVRA